uniref:C2H2-type domain-containing protein n=1 Tax=Macrostomum lignano TaxID=282301 RepID=A0A1I8FE14_9PLAT
RHGNASQAFDWRTLRRQWQSARSRLRRGRSSFSLMTDCADNLIDSSASSASHQFQEIFPPSPTSTSARTETTAAVAAEARASTPRTPPSADSPAVLTAAPADYDSSANGGNIGIELLLSAGSELVAASAEFCLCANCGLCCQGADRMRAHKTASGHLGFLRADPFDTFKCAQWRDQLESRQAVLRHVALHEEAPEDDGAACGAAVAAVPSAPSGPFDCAVCGRGLPAVSDLTAHAAQTGHSQFKAQRRLSARPGSSSSTVEAGRAAGCSRKLAAFPSGDSGRRPSSCPCACSAQPGLPELLLRMSTANGLAIIRFRLFSTGAASAGADLLQVASHISRFSHENFASLVDDCSRLADGPPPGQELPYLRVRLCPMRPGESHLALLIVALAEESAAADMASRSLQLAVARQNLGLPYSVNLCRVCGLRFSSASPDELLAHARAAHIGERDLMDRKIALMTFITESADSATCLPRSSVYLTCLLCPTRLRFASDLPPHLNAAHRRPCPLCQKPILLPDGQASMRRHLQTVCITRCSLEAQLRRHRDADHSTTTLPPPVKRRRRSIVDFGAAATQTRDTGDDRLLLCFTCGGEFISLSALRSHHSECRRRAAGRCTNGNC